MNAIEGKVGEPRPKYVHTSDSGVWDKPSCLNNVETYATVPLIIKKGADWFNSIGTEGSKGTKIFSLVGKVNNTRCNPRTVSRFTSGFRCTYEVGFDDGLWRYDRYG
jgi:NADH:ubiquinone oxidoreductase subunit F (NADH-binding)